MRVFCGLTSVEDGVAAALVNERGGVIATSEVSDDPHGYVELCKMWVRHVDVACVSVADDGSTQSLLRLAAAGGQPTGTTSEVDDERGFDAAVRIGRAIALGRLTCEPADGGYPDSVARLVGSIHAMAIGRHGSQAGLIELLRQCHPTTLAAWPDPTCPPALELLRVLPDPADTAGDATAAQVAERLRGYADTDEHGDLVDRLMAASADRHPEPDLALADAIAAAADAVLACDRSNDALADAINEHLSPRRKQATPPPAPAAAPAEEEKRRPNPSLAASMASATARGNRATPPRGVPMDVPEEMPRMSSPASPSRMSPPSPTPPRGVPSAPRHDTSRFSPPQGIPLMPDEPTTSPLPPLAEPRTPAGGFPRLGDATGSYMENEFFTPAHRQPDLAPPDLSEVEPLPALPEGVEMDDDLLIFSQARSAWFKGPAAIEDSEDDWTSPADEGWRTAANVATSSTEAEDTTRVGLPRRVPQANLVPGSAILSDAEPAPIKRDAQVLASHTAGYFRGWSRARREAVGAGAGNQ